MSIRFPEPPDALRGTLTDDGARRLGVTAGPVTYVPHLRDPSFTGRIWQDGEFVGGLITIGDNGIIPAKES